MEVEEWDAALQQLAREREALDGAYQDVQQRLAREAAEAEETGVKRLPEERVAGLIQLSLQLGNFVNFEREHAEKLRSLLVDALRRLAEAEAVDLPPGWPSS
jgi:tRNA/tmRNA/rRNA uracil-C5-methylase (TrmA/RlmC/RlmD family)